MPVDYLWHFPSDEPVFRFAQTTSGLSTLEPVRTELLQCYIIFQFFQFLFVFILLNLSL
jgi:hypothetical protein